MTPRREFDDEFALRRLVAVSASEGAYVPSPAPSAPLGSAIAHISPIQEDTPMGFFAPIGLITGAVKGIGEIAKKTGADKALGGLVKSATGGVIDLLPKPKNPAATAQVVQPTPPIGAVALPPEPGTLRSDDFRVGLDFGISTAPASPFAGITPEKAAPWLLLAGGAFALFTANNSRR